MGTLLPCWWEHKLIQPLWRTVRRFLKKLRIKLPQNPATPLLGICLEKTTIEKDTCTPMFTASLITISRTWKQPRCPSTDEWVEKLWYIYTMEYYSAIKRNVFEPVLMRWVHLEPIPLSEVSQKEKNKCHILIHTYGIQKGGTDKTIFRAAMEMQTYRTDLWTQRGKERVGQIERVAWKHIHYHM